MNKNICLVHAQLIREAEQQMLKLSEDLERVQAEADAARAEAEAAKKRAKRPSQVPQWLGHVKQQFPDRSLCNIWKFRGKHEF